MKVLFCATVDYHFKAFHLPYLRWFQEQGWEVHVAANGQLELPYVDRKFDLPICRSPFRLDNVRAYRELKVLIETGGYELIHCHTPMGGVLTRLAARGARSRGTKVLYTAHGFHFCKGAPLLNWFIYYPIERLLSAHTDCLITINREDYTRATEHRFRARRIEHVHGVGVDTNAFRPLPTIRIREGRLRYGYRSDELLLFYAAEFNRNKNQRLLIESLAALKEELPTARLLLAGDGPLLEECRELADRLQVGSQVDFLGRRSDIPALLPLCDIAVASSLREGLPVNVMEAMACGLPVVATRNRGHLELVEDGQNGYLVAANDPRQFRRRLLVLGRSATLRRSMGQRSLERMATFSLDRVAGEWKQLHIEHMAEVRDGAQSQYHRAHL